MQVAPVPEHGPGDPELCGQGRAALPAEPVPETHQRQCQALPCAQGHAGGHTGGLWDGRQSAAHPQAPFHQDP